MTDKQRQLLTRLLRDRDTLGLNHSFVDSIHAAVDGRRPVGKLIASGMIDTLLSQPYRRW